MIPMTWRSRILLALTAWALLSPAGWQIRAAELNPKLVGTYVVSSGSWNPAAIAAAGSRAFVTYSDYNSSSESWENGLLVLDIADPASPTRLGGLKARWVSNLAVRGDYAFVCASSDGLLVIDVSNPAAPRRVRGIPVGQAAAVFLAGNYAYVADATSALVIVDISDPASARRIVRKSTAYEASDVFVAGKYAYISERYWDSAAGQEVGALRIMDVSEPTSPLVVGEHSLGYGAWSVLVAESVAYLGGGSGEPLELIDVGDASTPAYLGSFTTLARGIKDGNRFYMYGGAAGLEILDVSQPAMPRVLGGYKPNGTTWGVGVTGNHAVLGLQGQGVAVIEIEPPPPPPPALAIARMGNTVTLAWPAAATGFGLETAAAFGGPPNWLPEPTLPEIVGDQNVVTLEAGAAARFFRLKKP